MLLICHLSITKSIIIEYSKVNALWLIMSRCHIPHYGIVYTFDIPLNNQEYNLGGSNLVVIFVHTFVLIL